MLEIFEILDRFEILYPDVEEYSLLRRSYTDRDMSSIFKLFDEKDFPEIDDLRKAVLEKNIHSIFRCMDSSDFEFDFDDFRSAITEKNTHSLFRFISTDTTQDELDDFRRAVNEHNLYSIFRLVPGNDELRKAVTQDNLHSVFRLLDYESNLRKLVLDDNMWKLWPLLKNYNSEDNFSDAFKTLHREEIVYDKDCFSRGQLQSKLWLVEELKKLEVDLRTVFICAGWYGTLSTLLFQSGISIDKIRSFDMDPDCENIARVFNKPWVMDDWRFQAVTENIHAIDFERHHYFATKSCGGLAPMSDSPDTIINTSCEHIENFDKWYDKIPHGKLVILQNNNFLDVEEHINCYETLEEFSDSVDMFYTLYEGELDLGEYKRFMKIGYR